MTTAQDTIPPLSKRGKPPLVSTLRRRKLIAFGWYGGKYSHLDWLLPLLPPGPPLLRAVRRLRGRSAEPRRR